MNNKGFTLIELLIVIAIIAILVGVVFVALDPLTRFKDSRDAHRFQDIIAVATGIKVHQIDSRGAYAAPLIGRSNASNLMIGTATSGCNGHNGTCALAVASAGACVDLTPYVTSGHLSAVPISPVGSGTGTWDATRTGYVLVKNANGTITIQSCEAENTTLIKTIQ